MLSEIALALCLAMGPGQCATCGPSGDMSGGSYGGGGGGGGATTNPYDSISAGGGGGGDQLYPFDSPEPWLHGWFQEIPAFGGYHSFRPHNYKHVLAQMEVAGRWGISPTMPYSHQWYHAFRQRAGMHPDFGSAQASAGPMQSDFQYPGPLMAQQSMQPQAIGIGMQPQGMGMQADLQQVGAIQRGYPGTAIPGIATPYYQHSGLPQLANAQTEYLDRLEQLQKQLEQQTFQMQSMQEQLRSQPQQQAQMQAWQQPNFAQFADSQLQQQPQQSQSGGGYQELPPASMSGMQPASGMQGQPQMMSPSMLSSVMQPSLAQPQYPQGGYSQPAPMMLPPASSYGQPQQMLPNMQPSFGPPPGYSAPAMMMQPGMQMPGVPMQGNPIMMQPGQTYYSPEPSMPQAGFNPSYQQQPGMQPNNTQAMFNYPAQQMGYGSPIGVQQSYSQPQLMQPGYGQGGSPMNGPQQVFYPPAVQSMPQGMNYAAPQSQPNLIPQGYRPSGRYGR